MATDDELLARVRRVMPEVRPSRVAIEVPGFELVRKLGAGGMGVVWEAKQHSPARRVALKLVRADRSSADALRRFGYEAEVLARLQHPGIAQIHAAGTFDSGDGPQPFFAMELIDGPTLLDHARELTTDDRLELFVRICRAVHHAHQKGVIHRDLKPSNILVDRDGQPKVLDFGVARLTDGGEAHTLQGQLVGTVPYMSPEQVRANPDDIDVRSDVYALGIVGFELLTGERPHDLEGKPVTEAVRVVGETEPRRLADFDPKLRGDLDVVFAMALANERERRYQSAEELAQDVERFRSNQPITARPPTTIYQLRKFVARHRALVAAAAVAVVGLLVGVVIATVQLLRAEREARVTVATNEYLRRILDPRAPKTKPGQPVTVKDAIDHAATRLHEIDDPLVEAAVREIIGSSYQDLGRLDDAREHLLTALKLFREHREPLHVDTARTLNQLGRLHDLTGEHDRALVYHLEALAMYTELLGPDDDKVGRSLANVGTAVHGGAAGAGDEALPDARELLERAVAIARRGKYPNWLASYLGTLGAICKDRGDLVAAEAALLESVETFRATPFDSDPLALIARLNLGQVLYERGDLAAAKSVYTEARELARASGDAFSAYAGNAESWLAMIEKRLR